MRRASLYGFAVPLAVGTLNLAKTSSHCDDGKASSSSWGSWIGSTYNYYFGHQPSIAGSTYNANNPTEDRFIFTEHNGKSKIKIGGVLDGHGGWQVAEFASGKLIGTLIENLGINDKYSKPSMEDSIDVAFNKSFFEIEEQYKQRAAGPFANGVGSVAKVGSCAVVALVVDDRLSVANIGDCRAVLGSVRSDPSTKKEHVYALQLTRDHNCREPVEFLKLAHEHPGENDIVVCKTSHACYVKGRLQLTRAFGDLYLKYKEFNAPPRSPRSRGRHIPEPATHPYLSAKPDIHHVNLTKDDRFVILATDGVWDFLTCQDAVEFVHNSKLPPAEAAKALVDRALEVAAEECGMTLAQMKQLPPGDERRGRHDDTTVVIIRV